MNNHFTIDDPLVGQEVTLVITLPAAEEPREARPLLLSAGIAPTDDSDQVRPLPISKSGRFDALPALLNEVWAALGLRLQQAETEAEVGDSAESTPAAAESAEVLATETVATEAEDATPAEPADLPAAEDEPPAAATPAPPAANLSLF